MRQVTELELPDAPGGAAARRPAAHQPAVDRPAVDRPAVDWARWPEVAVVPRGRFRAAIARRLFLMATARLPIRVQFPGAPPGGRGSVPVMYLHRPDDFFRRVGAAGLIGFGESYMAGDWDADDLPGLLTVLAERVDRLVPRWAQWLRAAYVARPPTDWNADESGARRNGHRHYDLSNEMFALFLDETMTYSAALFDSDGGAVRPPGAGREAVASCLAQAQHRKIDRLLDAAGVGPGSRVLEIGSGWGELAIRAAARGARVRTITVAAEQRDLARKRVAQAGLTGQVTIELADYREVTGEYDAIVSVEMIEAVAERYWPDYFRVLDRLLAPGGRVGIQAITMPHHRMLATRRTQTWILKYIFPGGLIPSVTAIEENLRAHTGLRITGRHDFGPHYAQTLAIWRDRFAAAAPKLAELGFDEVFRRMWELYLCYSQAGFTSGYLQVSQFVLARTAASAGDTERASSLGDAA